MDQQISRGNAARDRRDWLTACKYYERALKHSPQLAHIWVQFGHALKESGQLDKAEAAYTKAIIGLPIDADIHVQFGHLRTLQGNTEEAEVFYTKALQLDSKRADVAAELDRRRVPLPKAIAERVSNVEASIETLRCKTENLATDMTRVAGEVLDLRQALSVLASRVAALDEQASAPTQLAIELSQTRLVVAKISQRLTSLEESLTYKGLPGQRTPG